MTEEKDLHKEENASAGSTENEEIIELTDEIIELTDEVKAAPQKEDEIIDLVDEVVNTESTPSEKDDAAEPKQEPDMPAAPETSVEAAAPDASEKASSDLPDAEIMIGDDMDDDLDLDEDQQDDFVNSLGMDLETNSAMQQITEENETVPEPEPSLSEPPESAPVISEAVSSDQIEAAIERVIMKILPEKIDSILSAAIEKTLTKEIDKIKSMLLEDSSGNNV